MNQTIIIGYLGKDPESRFTPQGKQITSFSVAVGRQYNNAQGEKVKETLWFRCAAWDKKAEVCAAYLKKGSRVLIKGRLTGDAQTGGPKVWTSKDGTAGASFELTVEDVEFLSTQSEQQGNGIPQAASSAPNEDELPF